MNEFETKQLELTTKSEKHLKSIKDNVQFFFWFLAIGSILSVFVGLVQWLGV